MNRDGFKRLEILEAHQREVTMGVDIDRYLGFVAAVDGLTPSQVQEVRANVVADLGREPPTDAEVRNAEDQWNAMIAWEQEAVK